MTNKEFAEKLEKRTIKFATEIINLSASLPNTTEAFVLRNQLTNLEQVLELIIEKLIEVEAKKILKIKLKLV